MDQRQLQIVLKLQDQATAELRKLSGDLGNIQSGSDKASTSFGSFAKNILGVAAAYISFQKVYEAFSFGIRTAADLQTATIGLTTLLGSAEKATATMQKLKVAAASTPFELVGLSQAVQLLASVTHDGDKALKVVMDVGEGLAAMGKGQPELDRIIVNLQQIAATGRAGLIDIRQFAFAGIPIYELLTKQTGLTGEALGELISSGGVTFDMLSQMFDKANDAGGQFFDAYKNQAGTFNQAMSNMHDSVGIFLSDMLQQSGVFGGLTDAMNTASTWLMNYKQNLQDLSETIGGWIQMLDSNTGVVTLLKDAWQNIVFLYNEQLKPALDELWKTLQPLQPYLEALAKVFSVMLVVAIGGFIIIAGALALGLIELLTWFTKIANFLSSIFIVGLNAVRDTIAAVIVAVDSLIQKFKDAWDWAGKVAGAAGKYIGGAVSSVASIIPGRASGGSVMAGSPYVVGENGPELFMPSISGSIVPNGGFGASVNVFVYGDVSGADLIEKVTQSISDNLKRRQRFA